VTAGLAAVVAAGLLLTAPGDGARTIQFTSSWAKYVVSGSKPARGVPATVTPGSPATLIWRHEVAGNLVLSFGAVAPGTLVRVAFSETAEYLGVDGTSDWSRAYLTDDHAPVRGETWVDLPGCQSAGVCADGYRAFRFARVYVERGSARIVKASVMLSTGVGTPQGWFLSSDDELNRIWYASAYTAQLMQLPNDPAVLGPGCSVPGGPQLELIVDGAKRDRCPWLGDQAVSQLSLFLANGVAATVPAENTLSLFANAQLADGYIPASPIATSVLFDYPAYWVLAVDNLLLYRGELAQVGRYWPALVKVIDQWYPSFGRADGLIDDPYPPGDYAYIQRAGPLVAYYNALYGRALQAAAQIADALGHADAADHWRDRADALAGPFSAAFWDASAGVFQDSPTEPTVHPQDGNAFAILAGLASPAQAAAAIAFLDRKTRMPWGNAIADDNVWTSAASGADPSQSVYPFMTYFDVAARFAAGADGSALDELRRTWGWMLSLTLSRTGTNWEAIGAQGSIDGYQRAASSLASGWSTGALPALTNDVLGIRPTGPGFATFDAIPHPSGLAWAQGRVPTPAGAITFGFKRIAGGYVLRLDAPPALVARVGVPFPSPRVFVDGRLVAPAADGTVSLRGSHVVEVLSG
jgi:Bacterial alpha-L-rhamnosidase 6 hairpin glycosidase domain/Bacterial alpha-L-rhamnosidase C-terminal domain